MTVRRALALLMLLPLLRLASSGNRVDAAVQQKPPPRFSTRTEMVRVDVLVTRDNDPVADLTSGDFIVRDDGRVQNARVIAQGDAPIDIVLALDVSSSVAGATLDHLVSGVRALLDRLRPGDRLGLITFSHIIRRLAPLTADAAQVRELLARVTADGQTSLNDAAIVALLAGDPGVRTLVIVFTDGYDVSSWLSTEQAVNAARRLDGVVYGVTLGSADAPVAPGVAKSRTVIDLLPEVSGGRRLDTGRVDKVSAIFQEILREFRQRYVLAYEAAGQTKAGWHRLDVAVKNRRGVRVNARRGYLATP